jgi:hypothetical protein
MLAKVKRFNTINLLDSADFGVSASNAAIVSSRAAP